MEPNELTPLTPEQPEPTTATSQQHPLLIEYILTEIFSYYQNDSTHLNRFRLVCRTWSSAAAPVVKRSLIWKIGPDGSGRGPNEFMEATQNSKEDIFRNFHFVRQPPLNDSTETEEGEDDNMNDDVNEQHRLAAKCPTVLTVTTILSRFAYQIVELQFEYKDEFIHKAICQEDEFPNLEVMKVSIEDGGIFPEWVEWRIFLKFLPKLREMTICLADEGPSQDLPLEQLPQHLESLTIYGIHRVPRGLEHLSIRSLTSLQVLCTEAFMNNPARTISASNFTNQSLLRVEQCCKNLKILSLPLNPKEVSSTQMRSFLSSLAPRLEEMELVNIGVQRHDAEIQGIPFPKLKILRARNWNLDTPSFDMPALEVMDLRESRCNTLYLSASYSSLCLLYQFPISVSNMTELEIVFEGDEGDEGLANIFRQLVSLKRLHLGKSRITDAGIIGILAKDLAMIPITNANSNTSVDVEALRKFRFIGDLKQLQHFTFDGQSLSNRSIYYGLRYLTELTYVKLPPFHNSGPGYLCIERVDALALVDACRALVRIDVNGFPEDKDDSDEDEAYIQLPPRPVPNRKYSGCGLRDDDIERIRAMNPWLEIVHREKYSISERERAARRGHDGLRP